MAGVDGGSPRGTGYHVHAWLRGDVVPPERLNYRARAVGFGHTDMQPVQHTGSFSYILKCATHDQASLTEHLRLNGYGLLHARTFWWDATTNERLNRDEAVKRTHPPQ